MLKIFKRGNEGSPPLAKSAPNSASTGATGAPGANGAKEKSAAPSVLSPSAVRPGASALAPRPPDSKAPASRSLPSRPSEALAPHAATATVPGGKTPIAPEIYKEAFEKAQALLKANPGTENEVFESLLATQTALGFDDDTPKEHYVDTFVHAVIDAHLSLEKSAAGPGGPQERPAVPASPPPAAPAPAPSVAHAEATPQKKGDAPAVADHSLARQKASGEVRWLMFKDSDDSARAAAKETADTLLPAKDTKPGDVTRFLDAALDHPLRAGRSPSRGFAVIEGLVASLGGPSMPARQAQELLRWINRQPNLEFRTGAFERLGGLLRAGGGASQGTLHQAVVRELRTTYFSELFQTRQLRCFEAFKRGLSLETRKPDAAAPVAAPLPKKPPTASAPVPESKAQQEASPQPPVAPSTPAFSAEEGEAPDSIRWGVQVQYGVEHGKDIGTRELENLLRGRQVSTSGSGLVSDRDVRPLPVALRLGVVESGEKSRAFRRAFYTLGGGQMGTTRQAQVVRAAIDLFLKSKPPVVDDGKVKSKPPVVADGEEDFVLFIDELATHFNLQRGDSEGYEAFCENCLQDLPVGSPVDKSTQRAIDTAFGKVAARLGVKAVEMDPGDGA